ncbi:MAG TPA: TonB-dependent receptor, partial [Blastocatellia bacterium]|nr:TonB-dependent receptor [Blastocatellia bacterium]
SGTNAFHGSGDAFGRSDLLDATNPFVDPTLPRQTVDVINFGADVGGPIKKDKAFFFVGYAGQRYSIGNPAQIKWPTLNSGATLAQGGAIAACQAVAASSVLSPTSLTMAGLDANCNRTTGPSIFQDSSPTSSQTVDFNTTVRSDNGLAKVDWHLNEKHSLTMRIFVGNSSGPQVNSVSIHQAQWRPNPFSRDYTLGANETWIVSSNVVNEIRFGYTRFTQAFINGDCDSPLNPTLNLGTEICGMTNVSISGFSGSTGCCGSFPKYQGPDYTPELIDHVSINHGNHAFKFGVELRDDIFNGGTFSNSKGNTSFAGNAGTAQCPSGSGATAFPNALENFMAGCINSSAIFVGSPLRHISQFAFAAFGQDDWRITPRFTLNLGLRYEYVTPISESQNRLANFDPNIGLFQVGSIGQINLRDNAYLPDKNNFAPRLGFAWDVQGNGKWVVRGGAGISYVLEGFNIFTSQQNSVNPTSGLNTNPTGLPVCTAPGALPGSSSCVPGPGSIVAAAFNINASSATNGFGNNWNQQAAFNGGTIYPGSNVTQLNCQPTKPCNIMAVQQNMVTPYVTFWSLGVQHAFTNNLSLDLSYVGNHGTKLLGLTDLNNPILGSGYCMNISAAQAAAAQTLSASACPTGVRSAADVIALGPAGAKANASVEQASRPFFTKFPYYGYIWSIGNYYGSNYNGLQATLTQRVTHGLTATVGYTFAHAMDDSSNDWGGTSSVPQNPFDTRGEYSNSSFDITHRFTGTITYALPGRSGFGQMLEGWKVTSIVTLESALPWGVIGSKSAGADTSGTGEFTERWNYVGNYGDFNGLKTNAVPFFSGVQAINNAACVSAAGGPGTPGYLALQQWGCFQQGNSVMVPPAIGGYGDLTRNTFRGNGLYLWDASVMKDWRFTERLNGE